MTGLPDTMTLAEAREWLRPRARDGGAHCPCCNQFAKVYRRRINKGMARALIAMYRTAGTRWVHVQELSLPGGDYGKLRYWGLVEGQQGQREDGSSRVGVWRVTAAGQRFLQGQMFVPKYALLYDGRLLGHDGELIDISVALGEPFHFAELMDA